MGESYLHISADGISKLLPASDLKPMKFAFYNTGKQEGYVPISISAVFYSDAAICRLTISL
ncbi:hypothetical protein ACTXT7_010821 [Hymenolepis weldensis]